MYIFCGYALRDCCWQVEYSSVSVCIRGASCSNIRDIRQTSLNTLSATQLAILFAQDILQFSDTHFTASCLWASSAANYWQSWTVKLIRINHNSCECKYCNHFATLRLWLHTCKLPVMGCVCKSIRMITFVYNYDTYSTHTWIRNNAGGQFGFAWFRKKQQQNTTNHFKEKTNRTARLY